MKPNKFKTQTAVRRIHTKQPDVTTFLIQHGFTNGRPALPPDFLGSPEGTVLSSKSLNPDLVSSLKAKGFTHFQLMQTKPARGGKPVGPSQNQYIAFYKIPDLETRLRQHIAKNFFP